MKKIFWTTKELIKNGFMKNESTIFCNGMRKISYKEWQRLNDYFNGQQINEMGRR
jgi:hypothetical protein